MIALGCITDEGCPRYWTGIAKHF